MGVDIFNPSSTTCEHRRRTLHTGIDHTMGTATMVLGVQAVIRQRGVVEDIDQDGYFLYLCVYLNPFCVHAYLYMPQHFSFLGGEVVFDRVDSKTRLGR